MTGLTLTTRTIMKLLSSGKQRKGRVPTAQTPKRSVKVKTFLFK